MDFIMEHLIVGIAVMFVIIACRVFQANVALALGDDTPKLNGSTSLNPVWGKIIYSLSNAFMCFLIALISAIIYIIIGSNSGFLFLLFRDIFSISIVFGIIGLIPLPPFDGAIFVSAFLSREVEYEYFKLSNYTTFILLALILTRTFGTFLSPVVNTVGKFIIKLAYMLVM